MKSTTTYNISLILLLVTLIAIFFITKRGDPIVARTNLENIPMRIGPYTGTEDSFSEAVYEELKADCNIYRHYRSEDGTQISLYIGYYGTAKGGRTGHNPYGCLPGAGWGIIDDKNIQVQFGNKSVPVNYLIAKQGNAYETVIHWYQSDRNKILANGFYQNIHRFIGRLMDNTNDGAFVRVSMRTDQRGLADAFEKTKKFTADIIQILPLFWPQEITMSDSKAYHYF